MKSGSNPSPVHVEAFLSHARHELCTPINAILGYSEMLIEDAEDQGNQALTELRRIQQDGRRLLGLVSAILDTARFRSQSDSSLDGFTAELRHRMSPFINAVCERCVLLIEGAGNGSVGYVSDLQKIHTSGERLLSLIDHLAALEAESGSVPGGVASQTNAEATRVAETLTEPPAQGKATEQASLLVVDDNDLNREMLSRRFERLGFSVTLAEDGYRALEFMRSKQFDLVLLDIKMPGIDGMEVLAEIRQSFSVKDLPVIMATADDRSQDIVQALAMGANDYVTKPFDFPVVVARVQTQLSLKHATQALEAAHSRMKGDLEAAARIQLDMMPTALPQGAGVQFGWTYQPCDELAGDSLGIQQLDEQHIGFYVLDVSGHGVRSALLAVTVNRLLSHTKEASIVLQSFEGNGTPAPVSPARVVEHLNRRFPIHSNSGQYFTLFYGVLNVETLELVYVSAGHPGPIHLSGEQPAALPALNNFAIGWFPEARFEESRVLLKSGDRLYICSDGVLEAGDPETESYDHSWLTGALRRLRSVPLQESVDILARKARKRDHGRLRDDVSIVAVEI